MIPQTVVVKLQDKAQVYKVKADSTATAVEVTTEDTGNGKDFIVTSGLNEGDQIVTTGANNVTFLLMKNNIFINRYVMACAISIVIALVGYISMKSLSIEQYPNIAPPTGDGAPPATRVPTRTR